MECQKNFTPVLNQKGIYLVIRCKPERKNFDSLSDLKKIVYETLGYVTPKKHREKLYIHLADNEPIGTNFILYRYHVKDHYQHTINCFRIRVITKDNKVSNVLFTVGKECLYLLEE